MDTKTLYAKIAAVPPPITRWLGSEAVIDNIDKMDDAFTLPSGSGNTISKLIQKLEIKEIAAEYFSGELAAELKLEKDKAVHITSEIKKNILSPIAHDLSAYGIQISDLDKFQMPPIKNPIDAAPKVIHDIGPSVPTPKLIPTMQATSQTMKGSPVANVSPLPLGAVPPKPAAAPKPPSLSDVGWSKTRMVDPVIKLDISRMPSPAPMPPTRPQFAPPQQAAPANKSLGEFERLNMMKTAPGAPATASTPTAGPAPMILHEDTSFRAAEKNADFKIIRPAGDADMHLNDTKPMASVSKPVVIEFGKDSKMPSTTPTTTSGNVVHYTEFRPSLSSVPTANSGPRNVDQITPSAMPASRPAAVPVPRPPQPPTPPAQNASNTPKPPQGDVIVKNFP